jgi:hypothetical protein
MDVDGPHNALNFEAKKTKIIARPTAKSWKISRVIRLLTNLQAKMAVVSGIAGRE